MTKLHDRIYAAGPKRILSIDGGGVRNAISLGFLERIEEILANENNDPDFRLCNYFDLIGGWGSSAVFAAGLAVGMRVSEIKKQFLELGTKIFGLKSGSFYNSDNLDNETLEIALKNIFGDYLFGDQEKILTGLCIFTKSAETYTTQAIHNHPEGEFYTQFKEWPLWKVILASSAPTSTGTQKSIIDAGISVATNPSLRLFLLASLPSNPYHWRHGKRNMLMVSLGTGNVAPRGSFVSDENNPSAQAANMPEFLMHEANLENHWMMQLLSNSPTSISTEDEMGKPSDIGFLGYRALTYLRYNVSLDEQDLKEIGFDDNHQTLSVLTSIGEKAAKEYILAEHFAGFKHKKPKPIGETYFVSYKEYDLPFEPYAKKNIPIGACRIEHDFEIMTMEGLMHAKAGDYLIKGVRGEYYACDAEVFHETYAKM